MTSIELKVSYDDAWQLERFDIDIDGVETSVAASPTVELWVPDSTAGEELSIEVSGMRKNGEGMFERYAFGKTSATPVLAEVVIAQVALTRLPCGAWCSEGESSCQEDSVVTCANRDDDSCLEWADPVACAGGDGCSLGACRSECIDECAAGELRCAGPAGVQQCGNFDSDDCLEWSDVTQCDSDESCSGGSCVQGCRDECTDGENACSGGGVITCSDRNLDGCTEWGPVEGCGEGQSCHEGQCINGCVDECSANTCEGATLRECGQFDADECLDKSPGTSCNPVDLCIEGLCDATAGCSTTEKVCEEPPPSECINATTLRSYEEIGQCGQGVCDYMSTDTVCDGGCKNNTCKQVTTSCTGRTWTTTEIRSGINVFYQSLAVSPDGKAHVSYQDSILSDLRYATNATGSWQDQDIDTGENVGAHTSIALDSRNGVHISYSDATSFRVKYASNASGSWKTEFADGGSGWGGSIAVDSNDIVHFVYFNTADNKNGVAHATKSTSWQRTQVAAYSNLSGGTTSIATAGPNKVYITYDNVYTQQLFFGANVAGNWQLQTLVNDSGNYSFFPNLAVDEAAHAHIAYRPSSKGEIIYASNATGSWQSETLSSGVGKPAIAYAGNAAHITYQNTADEALMYSTNQSGTWKTEIVASDGTRPAIAIDRAGAIHILFYESYTKTLKHAVGSCP